MTSRRHFLGAAVAAPAAAKAQPHKPPERLPALCEGCLGHFPRELLRTRRRVSYAMGGSSHPDNLIRLCGGCTDLMGNGGITRLRLELHERNRRFAEWTVSG